MVASTTPTPVGVLLDYTGDTECRQLVPTYYVATIITTV
jgi:hypothetical protein